MPISDQDFLRAAFTGDVEMVRQYIRHGDDVNVRAKRGQTALMLAIWGARSADIVRLLLDADADYSPREESSGWRALTYAAVNGLADILQMLLDRGDRYDPATDGKALLYTVQYRNHETLAMLIEQGADLNVRDDKSRTSLMRAVLNSDATAAAMLLEFGADVNLADDDGMTALMHAAGRANIANVEALVARGADRDARNHEGQRAIDIARAKKRSKMIALLEGTSGTPDAAQ